VPPSCVRLSSVRVSRLVLLITSHGISLMDGRRVSAGTKCCIVLAHTLASDVFTRVLRFVDDGMHCMFRS
jgi:hypothetical protein